MDKKRELWNRFLDTQKDYLTAKNGHTRRVLGIYLSGSFGRKMARSESDLDLLVLLKEDKYDWLTGANLQGHVKLRDQDLLADIAQELHLPYTPLVCDVKFTGLAHFYKELMKMNPNVIDAISRGPVYVSYKRIPSFVDSMAYAANGGEKQKLPYSLKQSDYMHVNQLGYISATLGMANGIYKGIDKLQNMKEIDLIDYFIRLILPYLPEEIPYTVKLHRNYHQELSKVTLDDLMMQEKYHNELRRDALSDIKAEIEYLKKLHDKALFMRQDAAYLKQESKAYHQITDLFLKAM